jgi:hypothetical protein
MTQVAEVCACGAQCSIASNDAVAYVKAWRTEHLCPARHELSQKLGYDLFSTKPD